MMMFGPKDAESPNTEQSMRWKIKRFSNDELRQKFIDVTVPQADYLGLKMPDENIKYNEETGHYEFGELNWEEFWHIIAGNGPCNKQRLKARVKAYDDGAWVREAAMAYSEKAAKKKMNKE
jgi:ring-1,2-phenylacetyl-CoA epoxidase subunit PaaA